MAEKLLPVAQELLLRGRTETGDRLNRDELLEAAEVASTTFRSAGSDLGAHQGEPGLRFFDSAVDGHLAFGPGAGVAVGLSVGARTVRAVLVDANGWEYYHHETKELPDQLSESPAIVLNRIREAAKEVLAKAFKEEELLVDGALPMLGWSVAWPSPVDRDRRAVGHALSHNGWRSGTPLDQRVERELGTDGLKAFAIPDAHAAAIAVAHRETHVRDFLSWKHPKLTVVVRLAGNISAAVIVLEPSPTGQVPHSKAGFAGSVLLGGVDNHAGQIGHAPLRLDLVEELNKRQRPKSLKPLRPHRCSCMPRDEKRPPGHLEAYASALALTQRVHSKLPRGEALSLALDRAADEPYNTAFKDIGALVGDTLRGPVAMLNPANIVLTGSLAVPAVKQEIDDQLTDTYSVGTRPRVFALEGDENDYVRAKGAALAVIRHRVHRRLDWLLHKKKSEANKRVHGLTQRLPGNPL